MELEIFLGKGYEARERERNNFVPTESAIVSSQLLSLSHFLLQSVFASRIQATPKAKVMCIGITCVRRKNIKISWAGLGEEEGRNCPIMHVHHYS